MPSVDVAMARSLRGGVWTELKAGVVNGITRELVQRNIVDDTGDKITDVKTAFSSWDNCMEAAFCKWPVIAVMVIGGLIIIGVLWCIIRCACCGVSCCCSCFRCLKCCGNCCGCCDPPGGRPHKYLDEPYNNQGYRTEAPMQAHFPPVASKSIADPPQYAEFDVSKKGGDDSLPAMPSWERSNSRKVEEESVEMEPLKKSPTSATDPKAPLIGGSGPASPMELPSPYGQPGQPGQPHGNPHGYSGARSQSVDPYSPQDQGYSNYNSNPSMTNLNSMNNAGNRESVGFGLDQPYDTAPPVAPVPVMAGAPGRQSPAPSNSGYRREPMDQGYAEMPAGPAERGGYDAYGQGGPRGPSRGQPRGMSGGHLKRPPMGPPGYGMRRQGTGEGGSARGSPAPYGMDPRMRNSPGPRRPPGSRGDAPYGHPSRSPAPRSPAPRSPAPRNDYGREQPGYSAPMDSYGAPASSYNRPADHHNSPANNYSQPVDSYTPPANNFNNRSYSPAPERQFAAPEPANPMARPTPPPTSPDSASPITNNSGFDFTSGFARPQTADNAPNEPRDTAPKEAYPGYKPYQPGL